MQMLTSLFPALNQGSGGNVLSVTTSLPGDSWDSKALQNLIWTPFPVLRGSSRALRLKAILVEHIPRQTLRRSLCENLPSEH